MGAPSDERPGPQEHEEVEGQLNRRLTLEGEEEVVQAKV
jgi:hypothetical protein